MGHGITYDAYALYNRTQANAEKMNLIPTWGYPGSDILLASNDMNPIPATPIGRLSALFPYEIAAYLQKMQEYEQQIASTTQTIAAKKWMKNVVHIVGGNDASLDQLLTLYLDECKVIAQDTLYGANVHTFSKQTTGPVTPITNAMMSNLWQEGIGLITYFGHSAATSLDYNLNNPEDYNNTGKYPVFLVSGCSAGNIFNYDTSRLTLLSTLSEKFILAKQKGVIGFIASTHFGLTGYLQAYNLGFYRTFSKNAGYGKSIGTSMQGAITNLATLYGFNDHFNRLHAEQTTLHGDPVFKMYGFAQPDFAVEEQNIAINPVNLSVNNTQFSVKVLFNNLGKASGDSVSIRIVRRYPNGSTAILEQRKIKVVKFSDSLTINVPILPSRDAGENRIIASIDVNNQYPELSETNNEASRSFFISSNGITPITVPKYAIITGNTVKLVASTANPLGAAATYLFEIDTTELFNSAFKITRTQTTGGGIIEFDPGITLQDSIVYYWRVAPANAIGLTDWSNSSFIYLSGGSNNGYNQSHFYQHTHSTGSVMFIDTISRTWKYKDRLSNLFIQHSIFPTSGTQDDQFSISINGSIVQASACVGRSVIFNVFDPVSLKPFINQSIPSTTPSGSPGFFMGSGASNCGVGRAPNFEFSYLDTTGRRRMRDFMDWIPNGHLVVVKMVLDEPFAQQPYIGEWINDQTVYGVGNTVYDRLKAAGFSDIDLYTYPRTWVFIYKKNEGSFTPIQRMSQGLFDRIIINSDIRSSDTAGSVTSPVFGPAKAWIALKWRGVADATDDYSVTVVGVTSAGIETNLLTANANQQDVSLSSINANTYPYLKLKLQTKDAINLNPFQLRYWRVTADFLPEGALAANIGFTLKDTVEQGEPLLIKIPFKNISNVNFTDSISVIATILDNNNVVRPQTLNKLKPIVASDTALIQLTVDTKVLPGNNTLNIQVNQGMLQPEQTLTNNFLYKNFYVKPDVYNPLMDVTFDGVRILNGDVVSAKPAIAIRLKDESKYLLLDDTALVTILLRYPSGITRRFAYGTDTLKFNAAANTNTNTAIIDFLPHLIEDGEYILTVRSKDKSGNITGPSDFTILFNVYNKPMVSDLFNYPNPFTTSTAFVFTITGSQVPQTFRIQILTITGKIVREINKEELGSIHVGKNITEFKWDGTDQYGQKLANGVYLYRVITNLNGNKLDKFELKDAFGDRINTDQYFKKGYGKMYLMR
jgi:hypothetical protein